MKILICYFIFHFWVLQLCMLHIKVLIQVYIPVLNLIRKNITSVLYMYELLCAQSLKGCGHFLCGFYINTSCYDFRRIIYTCVVYTSLHNIYQCMYVHTYYICNIRIGWVNTGKKLPVAAAIVTIFSPAWKIIIVYLLIAIINRENHGSFFLFHDSQLNIYYQLFFSFNKNF